MQNHGVRPLLSLPSAWLFSCADTSQLGRRAGPALALGGGPGSRECPGKLCCCHCSVPWRPPSQQKSLRHGTGKVRVGMRVGKEIRSEVTFHSQSREQHWALALGSAPAPHRAGGPRGCPAILWLSPAAPAHRHGINQVTCTHTGVEEGQELQPPLSCFSRPTSRCVFAVLPWIASGMRGVWAEGWEDT